MNRILVIRGGAIGDFVLTLPAIAALRQRFPSAHLEILGYQHIIALAENGYADATRSIEYAKLASFFAKGAVLVPELHDYFASFDLVLSYLYDPDAIFEANILRCGVDKFVIGPAKISDDGAAARQLARPVEQLGVAVSDIAARIQPSVADRSFARDFLGEAAQKFIALHPGSGSSSKNWPIERWIDLARIILLEQPQIVFVLVSGEADETQMQKFRAALPPACVRLAAQLRLPQLAAVLERCPRFIGHDSGVSHIAAAVGTPCLLLFGPTDPAVWAPANKNVQVIRAPNEQLDQLTLEDVKQAFAELTERVALAL